MPAVSERQQRYMAMASTPKGRAKLRAEGRKVPPQRVAEEFRVAGPKVKRRWK